MSAIPLEVLTRPFAIEPVTNIMMPDGIFDNAIYNLRIAAHFTNTSASALTNVTIYFESVGDPGIATVARTHFFASIPAGASVLVAWNANFQYATPGKRLVSFIARGDGFESRRSIQQIFVSQTRFDSTTNSYTIAVEEGTLTVSNISGILPDAEWVPTGGDDRPCRCPPTGPVVPTGMTMAWAPNPAYAGTHGELPFSDPWWKVLAWIVVAVAALVAIIATAVGSGTTNFSTAGTVEETDPSVECCTPMGAVTGEPEHTVAGVASFIASIALLVALADEADPFWRGQEARPPAAGEMTIGERVVANWRLPEAPNAGRPFQAQVAFNYQRITTGQTYAYAVSETQTNTHIGGDVEIDAPATINAFNPLWLRARFKRSETTYFRGTDLYAFVVLRAPGGLNFIVPLTDDGLGFDPGASDTIYAGSLNLELAYRILLSQQPPQDVYGVWRAFVFAQDVNLTKPGTPPHIAAQQVGGIFVASALELTFDPTLPCPLKAQAAITVV